MKQRRVRGGVSDDWAWFEGVAGWESYRLSLQVAVIDGMPQATALRMEPLDGAPPVGLTQTGLKRVPLGDLAEMAVAATNTAPRGAGLRAAMRRASRPETELHDPRAIVTVEQVARVWHVAHEAGLKPRAEIMARLHVEARTADRYIARARQAALIPPSRRKRS